MEDEEMEEEKNGNDKKGKRGKRRFFSTTTTTTKLEKRDGANDQNCSNHYEFFQSFIYMWFQVYPNPGT